MAHQALDREDAIHALPRPEAKRLFALLPRYAGQVKCSYIDPPYNTGNEGWVYNDNVNSPGIRKWLGEAVGKEGGTLDRNDRRLCMMYPRLVLWKPNLLPRGDDAKARYKNDDEDPRAPWTAGDLQARNYYSEGTYAVTCPSGRVIPGPGKGMYWRVSKANFDRLDKEGRI